MLTALSPASRDPGPQVRRPVSRPRPRGSGVLVRRAVRGARAGAADEEVDAVPGRAAHLRRQWSRFYSLIYSF